MAKVSKSNETLNYSYQIYPPAGAHKGFRLIKIFKVTGKTETVKTPELEAINKSLVTGELSRDEARKRFEAVRHVLYERDGIKKAEAFLTPENSKVLAAYWKAEYEPRAATLSDPKTAQYELRRALEALGNLSLKTTPQDKLQKHLDVTLSGNQHRRVVVKLNSMLKFLKRDFTLELAPKERPITNYISLKDLPSLLEKLPDEDTRILHAVAFFTGVTLGEAFGLDQRTYSAERDTIRVINQVDKAGVKRATEKSRTTIVIPEGRDVLIQWFGIRSKFSDEVRQRISRYTKKAAALAFPKEPSKHVTFQDLRHSYAIHLLSQGIPLSIVADCLGIKPENAKEYYGNFELSGDAFSLASQMLRRSTT